MTTFDADSGTADTAKSEATRLADVTSSEAQGVADDVRTHARGLLDDARGHLDEQSRTQLGNLTSLLAKIGNDLGDMAGGTDRDGVARELAQAASDRAHALRSRLEGREPGDLLD